MAKQRALFLVLLSFRISIPGSFGGSSRHLHTVESTNKDELDLPLFDLTTILNATNYFSQNNKIGEGGFGPVYKVKNIS